MKERLIGLIKTYILFVCIFILQKPLFILYYSSLYAGTSWTDPFKVIWNGLPLDLSLAGYLTAIPGLLFIASAWTLSKALRRIWNGYYFFIAILLAVIFIVDIGLYEYWGFRLDATPLFYFFSSPKDALASISIWQVLGGIVAMILYASLLYALLLWIQKGIWKRLKLPYRRLSVSGVMLLLTGLLFIPIRGGFTVSTMNTGKVYFSSNQRLNHAAINPAFSLMESLSKQKDFGKQYRFMEAAQADELIKNLVDPSVLDSTAVVPDTLRTTLFKTERPNVIFVILESFSSRLMTTLGGEPDIAVQMDSLAKEGVLFTNFYANSFRTDRGLVAILSGYPAQPTTSIMKYPRKTQNLPAIAGSLRDAGYRTKYYYGGDADFTNMRSYLMSSGFENIISDQDFPVSERLSKWGANDDVTFRHLYEDIKNRDNQAPWLSTFLTLSSHEPFEVPYHRLDEMGLYPNSVAFTDSCIGNFIDKLKELPVWKNTLVIFVSDHGYPYPKDVVNYEPRRYHIPMLWIGGAVKEPVVIDKLANQTDLAATLLNQLGIDHGTFTFSRNILNPNYPEYAFYTYSNGFGFIDSTGISVYDNEGNKPLIKAPRKGSDLRLRKGKALLQTLYDDLGNR